MAITSASRQSASSPTTSWGASPIGPYELTPLALLFAEYVGFAVKPDSKIKTGKELLAALKTDAGSLSASMSGGGAGNHNHRALAIVTTAVGGDIKSLKQLPILRAKTR